MLSEPQFTTREPQPYAAIRVTAEQGRVGEVAAPLLGEVMGWLQAKGIEPVGAPFFNYTGMRGQTMDMEVGWPIAKSAPGDGRVVTGTLPGGRYVTVRYTGHYDGLRGAHEALHEWLAGRGTPAAVAAETGRQTLLEIYETNPDTEPDPSTWVTAIAFKLSD